MLTERNIDGRLLEDNGWSGLELRDYQLEAVAKIVHQYSRTGGCILADEMGLGKTCTAVASIFLLKVLAKLNSALIISPLSIVDHWKSELERVSINLSHVIICGTKEERDSSVQEWLSNKVDVLLTTYDVFLRNEELLVNGVEWSVIIFDEAHRLKNQETAIHKLASRVNSNFKLLLTGTPIQNNLSELYALLRLCEPDRFTNESTSLSDTNNDILKDILCEYMIRRSKLDVGESLNMAEKSEMIIFHNLTRLQRDMYVSILRRNIGIVSGIVKGASINNVLIQLRKCVLHPYLFKGVEPEPFHTGDHLINASGKLIVLDKLLSYLLEHRHKCLIFSQFTSMLDIVQDYMEMKQFEYERLDGSVRAEERFLSIKNFQKSDNISFFLLSTRSGGTGLNLMAADTVIFLDVDFNPQNDLQAAARCHRIGQKKRVKIIRLICAGTVEEMILNRAMIKLKLSDRILGNSEANCASTEEIRALIQSGLDDLVDSCDVEKGLKALEQISGTTDPDGQWSSQIVSHKIDTSENLSVNDIYEFEGVTYRKLKKPIEDVLGIDKLNNYPSKPKEPTSISEERMTLRAPETQLSKQLKAIAKGLTGAPRTSMTLVKDPYPLADLEAKFEDPVNFFKNDDNDEDNIQYITGDVTKPRRRTNSETTIIVLTIDDSGEYPQNSKLYSLIKRKFQSVQSCYEEAFIHNDLHLSDVHLYHQF